MIPLSGSGKLRNLGRLKTIQEQENTIGFGLNVDDRIHQ